MLHLSNLSAKSHFISPDLPASPPAHPAHPAQLLSALHNARLVDLTSYVRSAASEPPHVATTPKRKTPTSSSAHHPNTGACRLCKLMCCPCRPSPAFSADSSPAVGGFLAAVPPKLPSRPPVASSNAPVKVGIVLGETP